MKKIVRGALMKVKSKDLIGRSFQTRIGKTRYELWRQARSVPKGGRFQRQIEYTACWKYRSKIPGYDKPYQESDCKGFKNLDDAKRWLRYYRRWLDWRA